MGWSIRLSDGAFARCLNGGWDGDRIKAEAGFTVMRVVVIGAGLSGLCCALRLASQGLKVKLFEGRRYPGGRAGTFLDPRGKPVEYSLNVISGSYRRLKRLLGELGTLEFVSWRSEEVLFASGGGRIIQFGVGGNGKLSRLRALLFAPGLSLGDKLNLSRSLLPALLSSVDYWNELDTRTASEWASAQGLSDRVVNRFIDPLARAFNFLSPQEVSAATLVKAMVVLAGRSESGRMGFLIRPASEILFQPLVEKLRRLGTEIQLGRRVVSLEANGERITSAIDEHGEEHRAEYFVLAVLPQDTLSILPTELLSMGCFQNLAMLGSVPAITVFFKLGRRVINADNLVYSLRGPIAVLCELSLCRPEFRKNEVVVQCILAPARRLIGQTDDIIIDSAWEALRELFPQLHRYDLLKADVYRVARATYRAGPGSESLRPSQTTPVENLFLAGDVSRQEFPASLEGAVISGEFAASSLLHKALSTAI